MKKVLKERSAQALALLTGMITFLVTSCSPALGAYCENRNTVSSTTAINTIASKVYELDTAGAFDELRTNIRSASYSDVLPAEEMTELESFLNSPVDYLSSQETINDSPEQLDLMYTIYSEGTVDEVIEKMEAVSSDMAEEYKSNISDFYENLDDGARAAIDEHGGMGNVKLSLFPRSDTADERWLLDPIEFSWGSVWIYVGCSAAAIAGMICYKWGFFPWIRYPGLAVCIASSAAMVAIVYKWRDSTEFKLLKNLTLSIVSSYKKITTLASLDDIEKRTLFLTEVYNSIEAAKKADSSNGETYQKVLLAIDDAVLGWGSFAETTCALLNFCWNNGDSAAKILTVGAATTAVGVVGCVTGMVGIAKDCWTQITAFIPKDVIILTKIGISLVTINN